MNPNQLAAFKNLEQAQQALKSGDKTSARQLAEEAVRLAPDLEEPWLLMAALSSPRESLVHLEKALKINPNSERAKKGQLWAQKRLQDEIYERPAVGQPETTPAPESDSQSVAPVAAAATMAAPGEPLLQPEPEPEPTSTVDATAPGEQPPVEQPPVQGAPASARPRFSFVTLLIVLALLVLGWAAWKGVTPVAAYLSNTFTVREHGPSWAPADIAKPNPTQSAPETAPTAAVEPTSVPTLVSPTPEPGSVSPTPTLAPVVNLPAVTNTAVPTQAELPSPTPLPTDVGNPPAPTAIPTEIILPATAVPLPTDVVVPPTEIPPVPTSTPAPTEVAQVPATAVPGPVEGASPTPLPTDTAAPYPTQYVPPTNVPNPGGGVAGGARWIDVDLTHQMIYAYEGNTVVNSFLVSTGTWQYPTVTGQYHIYIKLRYKDMSGPGYYLPNVPYTMFFYQGYAIHGTYWHNNFGTPMSHGCVNLSIPDSEWMYNFASVGTLVNVHY